uniref:Uncharacterized protein n=1 Tax=Panagrolaimus sp. ES5 TaxID=591445 RepID=A0AC34FKU0_9BILA
MEEDATLILFPFRHDCPEFSQFYFFSLFDRRRRKAAALKESEAFSNEFENREIEGTNYSPQTAAQEEQVAPFSIESESHEDGRLSLEAPKDSESNYSLHSAAQEEQVAPFSNEFETHESISKIKRQDTVKGNHKKNSKSQSRTSRSRVNMKKSQNGNAEGKGNKLIQKTYTNNLYKFQL